MEDFFLTGEYKPQLSLSFLNKHTFCKCTCYAGEHSLICNPAAFFLTQPLPMFMTSMTIISKQMVTHSLGRTTTIIVEHLYFPDLPQLCGNKYQDLLFQKRDGKFNVAKCYLTTLLILGKFESFLPITITRITSRVIDTKLSTHVLRAFIHIWSKREDKSQQLLNVQSNRRSILILV